MTLLWVAFGLLLVLALWLLVSPLRGARTLHAAQQDFEANDRTADQNVAIFRRRLASLEAALARGEIDQARFDEDRLDLERSLLEDTEATQRRPLKSPLSGRLAVPLVMVAVVIASVLWYQQQGAEGDLRLFTVQQEVRNNPERSLPMMIERLEQEAARQPDNPNVWSSLYPLYRDSGQGDEAIDALERLIELEGRHPALLGELAQIRFFVANRTLTDEVQALVDETLDKDPRQPLVLGMLGIHAFDEGRYEQAIEHWRRAIAGFDDPGSARALREGIAVAQRRLGVASDELETAQSRGPGIQVRVSLDAELRGLLDDDATVFVVARDMEGELPPLAVARTTLSELPLTVTLDDSHAMSDAARLSQVEEARLMVRVSTSGQATPQAGDLFGDRQGVAVGDTDGEPIDVVIDRVVE
ncbi:c-type cytochrome biogenesis protein CcmI [Litchfieldella qijiaojingensis]|uniref:C-type cytochrome biogenesis protein CcmI n=1 Tax=Litchfieldella qijiaojingensis TaxID=980347 RepID=A0ABQ2ZAW5_9GAMM|nr:c-type cytochrome biogenesis protein CcmI [Halomonas qijiaojingensis]GGY07426.1 c-type cytochrome biogenesis protein CcmI [Halomonas qijiaojingensis]